MSESESAQQLRGRGQPVFVLNDDSERTSGRDAQQANIAAGKAISETVRSTLGPQGMDKMLVSDSGDVVVTNDGATILEEMDIDHPAARMLVDVADEQEAELGDGTTTAAILAGELLSTAEEFIDRDIHPRTIVEGFHRAEGIAADAIDDLVLDDELDDDLLQRVAVTAMTGKGTGSVPVETLADTVVDAIRHVGDDGEFDRDAIHVETRVEETASATELIDGVVAEADAAADAMPTAVDDPTVAVVDGALEQREAEIDAEYTLDTANQLNAAVRAEEEALREFAEELEAADIDVAFVTDDVADRTAGHLASAGILAFEDVDDDDAATIAAATGAETVPRVEDIDDEDLGHADRVEIEHGDDDVARVEGGDGAGAVTLLVRGGTEHVLDEVERTVSDGVDAAAAAYVSGEVVPGAGATEIALAGAARDAAAGIEGRTQLAVEAVADAFDAVPRTLATNAGRDPIDSLVDLRAANEEGSAGIVVGDGPGIDDPVKHGIVDAADVKRESIRSAVEVATMIVRIDDVISAE